VTSAPSLAIFRQHLRTFLRKFLFHLSYPDSHLICRLLYSHVDLAIIE